VERTFLALIGRRVRLAVGVHLHHRHHGGRRVRPGPHPLHQRVGDPSLELPGGEEPAATAAVRPAVAVPRCRRRGAAQALVHVVVQRLRRRPTCCCWRCDRPLLVWIRSCRTDLTNFVAISGGAGRVGGGDVGLGRRRPVVEQGRRRHPQRVIVVVVVLVGTEVAQVREQAPLPWLVQDGVQRGVLRRL
jgi:hypothetical protein